MDCQLFSYLGLLLCLVLTIQADENQKKIRLSDLQITAAGKTSAKVHWYNARMKHYNPREKPMWAYTIILEYVDGRGRPAEKTYQMRSKLDYWTNTDSFEMTDLLPCTDYSLRIVGSAPEGTSRGPTSAESPYTHFSTQQSGPIQKLTYEDMQVAYTAPLAGGLASVTFKWTMEPQAFGCHITHLQARIKKPDTWPRVVDYEEEVEGMEGGVTVRGLDAGQTYPTWVRPKNRFGYGTGTRLFFLQFPSTGPSTPSDIQIASIKCISYHQVDYLVLNMTWQNTETSQQIERYTFTLQTQNNTQTVRSDSHQLHIEDKGNATISAVGTFTSQTGAVTGPLTLTVTAESGFGATDATVTHTGCDEFKTMS